MTPGGRNQPSLKQLFTSYKDIFYHKKSLFTPWISKIFFQCMGKSWSQSYQMLEKVKMLKDNNGDWTVEKFQYKLAGRFQVSFVGAQQGWNLILYFIIDSKIFAALTWRDKNNLSVIRHFNYNWERSSQSHKCDCN